MSNIKLYIRGHSYENEANIDEGFILDVSIGDLNYRDKDIGFISFSNDVLYPEYIVILIKYDKYHNYIEQNKKQILHSLQCYANSIDSRIPKPK
jgi:hypothetical protein